MSVIILARHGQTHANLENRFAGRSAVNLTPEGKKQAHDLGRRLAAMSPAEVVCGPAVRTMTSARIIADQCGIEFRVMSEFDEIDLPHWDGLSKEEIKSRYGEEYPTWIAAPHRFKVRGCETIAAVRQRAMAGLDKLFDRNSPAVVVTHLIIVRAIMTAAAGQGIEAFRDFDLGNSEFVVLERKERGGNKEIRQVCAAVLTAESPSVPGIWPPYAGPA